MSIESVSSNPNWRVIELSPRRVLERKPAVIRLPVRSSLKLNTVGATESDIDLGSEVIQEESLPKEHEIWPDSAWINSLHRRDVKASPQDSAGVGTEG